VPDGRNHLQSPWSMRGRHGSQLQGPLLCSSTNGSPTSSILFLTCLLVFARAGDQSIGDSSPIDAPMTPNYISSFAASKRHKSSSERYVGSPISTMEPADFGSPQSPKSSKSGSRSSSPPNSSGAHLSRKNKQQRCSICKECGHKSRTCRFGQQGDNQAVDVLPMDSPPSSSRRSHVAQADAL